MARKLKSRDPSASPSSSGDEDITLSDPPSTINPYDVLSLEKTATADQIKSAYRRSALKHHPDKASAEDKETANKKFQEIAFAYAILSDEGRRKRYDTTGSTEESLQDDDDFDWLDFFREQMSAMVDGDMIDKIKKEYQGSEEERADVLRVYTEGEGNMDMIYEEIMCSNVLDDDKRIRGYINAAIKKGEVEKFEAYTNESKEQKKQRVKAARGEEQEAMELAEELGVKDKLFGKSKKAGKGTKQGDDNALKALIQQRQKDRAGGFFDRLEEKYAGTGGGKANKAKRKVDEPPEELFARNAKKTKGRK